MIEALRRLADLRLAPVSPDADRLAEILSAELPLRVREYPSGMECNGWTVPNSWRPRAAEIRFRGKRIYDGMAHPLGVPGYAPGFRGRVGWAELKEHLFHHPTLEDALVYHCDYFYKPWRRDWGFCVTRRFFDSLEEGEYEVRLEVEEKPGSMKVLAWDLPGEEESVVVLNAHTCHAAQANDDLAGVVVGVEAMRRLAERPRRRFSYRLVLAPEHLGTVFYLDDLPEEEVSRLRYALFLEMLGNRNRLALQESFTGRSALDRAARLYLSHHRGDHVSGPFRSVVGNDETVWEAPGYEIPCISLSRWPYPEYHSSLDTPEIIDPEMMEDAVGAVLGILDTLEGNRVMERRFRGLVCLGNPKYDLYISTEDPSIRALVSEDQRKWHRLMTCLYRYFDGETSLFDVAERHGVPFELLRSYVDRYEEKGLIRTLPA